MTSITDYALLANAVYDDDPRCDGFVRTAFRPGGNSGLQAAVFTKNGKTIVTFKGTSAAMDVVADLKLGVGINTSLFSEGEQFVAQHASGDGIVVTGHSLGGAIAQTVGNRRRLPFVSFNAPGVAIIASQNLGDINPILGAVRVAGGAIGAIRHPMQTMRDMVSAFHDSLGTNYRLSGDLVSQIGLHYGPIVNLEASGDPRHQHRMGTMLEVLGAGSAGQIDFPV